MPIYEYVCSACGHEFEKLVRSMNASEEVKCSKCGSKEVRKAFSVFGVSGGQKAAGAALAGSCAPTGG